MTVFRNIAAVLLSLLVFFLTVAIFDGLAGQVSALPAPKSIEEYKQNLDLYPSTFFLTMMSGWSLAAFLGTGLVAWIAPNNKSIFALAIGSIGLALTILNLCLVPHPAWVWLGVLPMAAIIGAVASWFRKPSTTSLK